MRLTQTAELEPTGAVPPHLMRLSLRVPKPFAAGLQDLFSGYRNFSAVATKQRWRKPAIICRSWKYN
jgi:hypothetical protein